MAGRRRPSEPPPLEVRRFTPEQAERAIRTLEARIADVAGLDPQTVSYKDEQVSAIVLRIQTSILETFGEHSPEYRRYGHHRISAGMPMRVVGFREDPRHYEAERQQDFTKGIPGTVTVLKSMIDSVKERTDSERAATADVIEEEAWPSARDEVFIVHGRKPGPREEVARLLTRLKLKPIILQEHASEGRTIIEKFEDHSNVGYAVVLLTGDDRGGLLEDDPSTYRRRARQNVILELGYFVGKLGRRGVCVLCEEDVDVPSDFHGVVYVPLDERGAWRYELAKEMRAAGLDIDFNLI